MGTKSHEDVLVRDRQGHTEIQKRRQCEDGVRDWSNEFISQGKPRIACNHLKLGDGHGTGSVSKAPEGTCVDTLILDFQPREL